MSASYAVTCMIMGLYCPVSAPLRQTFWCVICSTTYEPAQKFPSLVFLKELSFRTSDAKHAQRVVQEIKLLRSTTLQRDKERAERATLVAQEKLIRGKVTHHNT